MLNEGNKHLLRCLLAKRILLVVFIVLQAFAAGAYLYIERSRIEQSIATTLLNTTVLQVRNFELIKNLVSMHLKAIGDASFLGEGVSQDRLAREVQKEWIDAVMVLDTTGKIIGRASLFELELLVPKDVLATNSFANGPLYREWRAKNLDEESIYTVQPSTQLGGGGIVFYRAIKNQQGVFVGSVLGFFSNRSLRSMFQQNQLDGLALGDAGNVVVYDATSEKLIFLSQNIATETGQKFTPKAQQDSSFGHGLKYYISPLDGQLRLGAFKTLNHERWMLITGMSRNDYLLGWRIQVGVSIVALLFMIVLQWLLLNFIQRNQEHREQLAFEAAHDPLTGLANRRFFEQWAEQTGKQAARYQQPLSLLALDLDHFKRINDEYGHDAGDAVLKSVAHIVRGILRECDIAARFGGEEFVVGLPQTPLAGALMVAERVRAEIAAQTLSVGGKDIRCTISIGAVLLKDNAISDALKQADLALYQAKQMGRNCVVANDVSTSMGSVDFTALSASKDDAN